MKRLSLIFFITFLIASFALPHIDWHHFQLGLNSLALLLLFIILSNKYNLQKLEEQCYIYYCLLSLCMTLFYVRNVSTNIIVE